MADETNQPQQDPQGTQGAPPVTGSANPPDAPQNPTQGATGAAGPAPGDTDGDDLAAETDVGKLRHEAASRRRALRAVEAERDALRGREDRRDTAEVERLAGEVLADASDLWSGVELAELRGEDGAVDAAKVSEQLAALLKAKPHFQRPRDYPNLGQGVRPEVPQPPSFGAALKGGR